MVKDPWRGAPLVALTLALCGVVFVVDLKTPLGLAPWVFYLVPLAISLSSNIRFLPAVVAATGIILMVPGAIYSPPGVSPNIAYFNRCVGAASFVVIAFMGVQVITTRTRMRETAWRQAALARLAQALRGELDQAQVARGALDVLARVVGAQVGVLYGRDQNQLNALAGWAAAQSAAFKTLHVGEGLVGQALLEEEPKVLENIPPDHVKSDLRVTSGLGERPPRHLVVAPCRADDTPNAVIELGFYDRVPVHAQALLRDSAEVIGMALRSAQYRTRLQDLLQQTQQQSERLQVQQEELRASNEELEHQAELLRQAQQDLEVQQSELEQTNSELEEQAARLESQRQELLSTQHALEQNAKQVLRANQYKSEFLANMSHELRTPLNSALILSKLLSDNPHGNLNEEQIRYAQTIYNAGNDLLTLINDILDLSKIEAGKMDLVLEMVPVGRVVDVLRQTFAPLATQKRLEFVVDVAPDVPKSLTTDSQRLQQVLRNFLSNALKFTDAGRVSLSVTKTDGAHIRFTVADTGPGIPADKLQLIFEAFTQADGTTSRRYGGTGLGLSISQQLAQLLGGQIAVSSEEGKGSAFSLTVPVLMAPPAVEAPPSPVHLPAPSPAAVVRAPRPEPARVAPSGPSRSAKPVPVPDSYLKDDRDRQTRSERLILVVDDDPAFGRILFDLCHEMDFDCLVATSTAEALDLAIERVPAAVLLDVNLPDGSGLMVLERLKREPKTRHIPVHVLSVEDHTPMALALGAVGYGIKPVAREALVDALRNLEGNLSRKVRRVLVVEDDPILRQTIDDLLRTETVDILGVASAADAYAAIAEGAFDCIVLDLKLPDATGFEVLERLAADGVQSFPPIIIYTGRPLTEAEEQQLRRYSRSIIVKGARSPERLLDEVTLFLHQVESSLPADRQRMLKEVRHRDTALEGKHVLVVEDDVRNVFALSSVLEPRGVKLAIARNGREALERLRQMPRADLVLMDIMMPEMDGLTAMREIRKNGQWTEIPIIALTAKAMPEDQRQCLDAGANDYIAKPLDVDKLLSLCRVWVRR